MKKVLSHMRQAIQKYDMIDTGDRIAVAVSGGKDSMVMLEGLLRMRDFYPKKFTLGVICIDAGFDGCDFSLIEDYCKKRDVGFHLEKTLIKRVVFEEMKEANPCSLCSRMRRAALCNFAQENGYNKLSLGHNRDDANETLIMNLFYAGKLECFEPKTSYEDRMVTIIRPMISTPEGLIYSVCKRNNLPVMKKICPADGKTKREKVKILIERESAQNKKIKDNIYNAVENMDIFTSKEKE